MIYKFPSFGLSPFPPKLIFSFDSSRPVAVTVDGSTSPSFAITSGDPQGYTLVSYPLSSSSSVMPQPIILLTPVRMNSPLHSCTSSLALSYSRLSSSPSLNLHLVSITLQVDVIKSNTVLPDLYMFLSVSFGFLLTLLFHMETPLFNSFNCEYICH